MDSIHLAPLHPSGIDTGAGIRKAITIAEYEGAEVLELLYFLKVFSTNADSSMSNNSIIV